MEVLLLRHNFSNVDNDIRLVHRYKLSEGFPNQVFDTKFTYGSHIRLIDLEEVVMKLNEYKSVVKYREDEIRLLKEQLRW